MAPQTCARGRWAERSPGDIYNLNEEQMSKPAKANAWVNHIKAWSTKHKVPYACAVSMAECRKAYKPDVKRPTAAQLMAEYDGIEKKDYASIKKELTKDLKESAGDPQRLFYGILTRRGYEV